MCTDNTGKPNPSTPTTETTTENVEIKVCTDNTGEPNPSTPTTETTTENVKIKMKDPENVPAGKSRDEASCGDNVQDGNQCCSWKSKLLVSFSGLALCIVLLGTIGILSYFLIFFDNTGLQAYERNENQDSNKTGEDNGDVFKTNLFMDQRNLTDTFEQTVVRGSPESVNVSPVGTEPTAANGIEEPSSPAASTNRPTGSPNVTTEQPSVTTTRRKEQSLHQ